MLRRGASFVRPAAGGPLPAAPGIAASIPTAPPRHGIKGCGAGRRALGPPRRPCRFPSLCASSVTRTSCPAASPRLAASSPSAQAHLGIGVFFFTPPSVSVARCDRSPEQSQVTKPRVCGSLFVQVDSSGVPKEERWAGGMPAALNAEDVSTEPCPLGRPPAGPPWLPRARLLAAWAHRAARQWKGCSRLQTKFCQRTKEAPGRISEWEGKEAPPTIRLYPFQPQLGPVGSSGRERSHSLFLSRVECSPRIPKEAD